MIKESDIGKTVTAVHGTQKLRGELLSYTQGSGFGIYKVRTEHAGDILVTHIEKERNSE